MAAGYRHNKETNVEKWQEENEKLLTIKNRILDSGRDATLDEMAEMLLQIYDGAAALNLKITPLMFSTLAEIQYRLRSDESKTAHDLQAQKEIGNLQAYGALKGADITPEPGRVDKLAALIEKLGHSDIEIERVKRGGNMRKMPDNAVKIGRIRNTGEDIWAVWDQAASGSSQK